MKRARRTDVTIFEALEIRHLLSAGQLDTTFGNGGIVTTNQGMGVANRIVMQGDGRFVVNARRDDGGAGSFQATYSADGSLDGNNAIVPWAFDTSGSVTISEPLTQADEDGLGIDIVAPDGKVLHLGMMTFANSMGREAITRYNADGTLDSSFGTNGKVVLTWTADANLSTTSLVAGSGLLSVQADGSLLLARTTGFGAGADLQLVRLTASGHVDASFGTAGVATAIDGGVPRFVAVQADGKIVVATDQGSLGSRTRQANVIRFNANGTLDTSFGTGGRVTETNGGGSVYSRSLTITPDGKILLLGNQSTDGPSEDFVIRYNANGTRDNSFNANGKQTLLATTMGILLDSAGRIVTSGYTSGTGGRDYIFSQRINADGTIDTGYGDAGTATIGVDAKNYVAQAMALSPDGDLIIAGSVWAYSSAFSTQPPATDVLLVRLQGGDGAAGVQRAVASGHHHRSPKQAAREAAALAAAARHHHRSPKQAAREAAALAAASTHRHRSPKQAARAAAEAAGATANALWVAKANTSGTLTIAS
jgi:uncharacterized delta-60 repeat protein